MTLRVYAHAFAAADQAVAAGLGDTPQGRPVKHLPFTDASVDESVRGRRYLMACVMAEARHLPELRLVMRTLAVHERIHFNNESARRKRLVLSAVAEMPIGVFIVVAQRWHGATEFTARNACLTAVVERVQRHDVPRLVIESRDDDREDERHLVRVRQPEPSLVSNIGEGTSSRCSGSPPRSRGHTGAGASWHQLIESVVDEITDLRP